MPNEPDADDVFRIPVEVVETRSSFIVIRLRASSLQEAQARAIKDVHQLCASGQLMNTVDVHAHDFDWEHDEYDCHGLSEISGDIVEYGVDLDRVKEPTEAETKLTKNQLPLPLPCAVWFCPECGVEVKADEDGCCTMCGRVCEIREAANRRKKP